MLREAELEDDVFACFLYLAVRGAEEGAVAVANCRTVSGSCG